MKKGKCFLCGREVEIEDNVENWNVKVFCDYCTPDYYELTDTAKKAYFTNGKLSDTQKDELIKVARTPKRDKYKNHLEH